MPALRINGMQVAVASMSAARKLSKVGKRGRSFRGQVRDAQRGVRRSWEVEAVIQDPDSADPFIRMINGEGHMVDLSDGLQASTGLNPRPGHANLTMRPATVGAWGRGVLRIDTSLIGSDGLIAAYDIQCRDNDWTVLLWTYSNGVWTGSARRADGKGYRAGVRNDNAFLRVNSPEGLFVNVVEGVVELYRDFTAGSFIHADDLVLLPYSLSEAQMAMVTAYNQKWGPAPVLCVSGDLIGSDTFCMGNVTGVQIVQKPVPYPGLGWINNAKIIKFTLSEMDQPFVAGVLGNGMFRSLPPGSPKWWFDSNDVDGALNSTLADGAAVTSWKDKGTRAQNATQGTAANQPVFRKIAQAGRIQFMPSVQFDGTNDYLATSVGTGVSGGFTMAAVVRLLNTSGAHSVSDTTGGRRGVYTSGISWTAFTNSGFASHPTEAADTVTWATVVAVFNSTGSVVNLIVNGVNASVTPGSDAGSAITGILLGAVAAGSYWQGHIVEWIGWNDTSYGTPQDVLAYFNRKYGELPQ